MALISPPSKAETLSIVVPAHNEQDNVVPLFEAIRDALAPTAVSWRLILVDDGSSDATWQRVADLARDDPRVAGLRLSRNFGHQNALLAGLTEAGGRAVVTMDADLQHPPALLPQMLAAWSDGAKVVSTVRAEAAGSSIFKKVTSRLYYRLLGLVTGASVASAVAPGMSDFRLLDRTVVQELLRVGDSHLFLRGLVLWLGFRSASVPYVAQPRAHGQTSYGLPRMISLAVTGITAMSSTPLRLAVAGGFFAALLCLCETGYVLYVALVLQTAVPGWASILVVNTLFFAILFLYLGILGEYVARIFDNVRSRPRFVVEETIRCGSEAASEGPGGR
jgi:glycosyltransferase involved in cell wall biosynthesis